jgi:uroporphyrinogen decarboxylase
MSVDLNIEYAKECARLGADFVFTGDDYASTEGPLMSPKTFRELLYPGLKRVFAGFKEQGLLTVKHSDGNILSLLDMIIDAQPDCLDPIDPNGGLDIGWMKQNYGDRFAMKGNVDCAHLLTFGAMDEVVRQTKEVIRVAAPGGGFILSSSNSVHSKVKPENYPGHVEHGPHLRHLPDPTGADGNQRRVCSLRITSFDSGFKEAADSKAPNARGCVSFRQACVTGAG